MWNRRLNEKMTNRLIGYCQDKRVIVVGNSVSMFNNPQGEFIDSFDVVVRLGKGYPWPEFKDYLGTKTNIWMLSMLRASHYRDFVGVPYQVLNISQISLYDDSKPSSSVPKIFFEDDFQIYNHYFLMGNLAQTKSLIKAAYGKVDTKDRISQGALALAYFTKMIRSYKELHVIGFDFFEGKVQYQMDGTINEVSSYHLPVPAIKGANSNPHAGLYTNNQLDKKFILKLRDEGKIIFHEMQPLDGTAEHQEKLNLLLQKYRRKASNIVVPKEESTQNETTTDN